ncbi:MAG TPA: hypothetical protein VEC37_14645, partial [Bacillota bacterium]|nr:hypothetical protein [Bacillota bacterium]
MKKYGEICLDKGYINQKQLKEVLARQATERKPLGQLLLGAGYIDDEQLAIALSIQLELNYCRPMDKSLPAELIETLSARQAEKYRVVPVQLDSVRLTLATADPLDLERLDQLREVVKYKIKLAVASETQIDEAIKKYYGGSLDSVATV